MKGSNVAIDLRLEQREHPACEWVGVIGNDGRVVMCARPATDVIVEPSGLRHFACLEHLASIRARAGTGAIRHRPGHPPARPYPEAIP